VPVSVCEPVDSPVVRAVCDADEECDGVNVPLRVTPADDDDDADPVVDIDTEGDTEKDPHLSAASELPYQPAHQTQIWGHRFGVDVPISTRVCAAVFDAVTVDVPVAEFVAVGSGDRGYSGYEASSAEELTLELGVFD
jgi:hypothetical protein